MSSHGTTFNRDFGVTFTPEEIATGSAFYNYTTHSTYARGLEVLLGTYNFLDLAPRGRDEAGLPFPMEWVRHHDRYAESEVSAGYASAS